VQVVEPDGSQVAFPPPAGSFRAALLCVAFRAGAEVCPPSSADSLCKYYHAMSILCMGPPPCNFEPSLQLLACEAVDASAMAIGSTADAGAHCWTAQRGMVCIGMLHEAFGDRLRGLDILLCRTSCSHGAAPSGSQLQSSRAHDGLSCRWLSPSCVPSLPWGI
jgi:hypothetical protein